MEKIIDGIRKCLRNRIKDHIDSDNLIDKTFVTALNYADSTIAIHLDLARIEFERDANQMAADYREDR